MLGKRLDETDLWIRDELLHREEGRQRVKLWIRGRCHLGKFSRMNLPPGKVFSNDATWESFLGRCHLGKFSRTMPPRKVFKDEFCHLGKFSRNLRTMPSRKVFDAPWESFNRRLGKFSRVNFALEVTSFFAPFQVNPFSRWSSSMN